MLSYDNGRWGHFKVRGVITLLGHEPPKWKDFSDQAISTPDPPIPAALLQNKPAGFTSNLQFKLYLNADGSVAQVQPFLSLGGQAAHELSPRRSPRRAHPALVPSSVLLDG